MEEKEHEGDRFEPRSPEVPSIPPPAAIDDLDRARNLLGDIGQWEEGDVALIGSHSTDDDLERLYRLSLELHSSLNVKELLPRILDLAIECSWAERGALFYFDPKTGQSIPWAVRGMESDALAPAEMYSRTILDHTLGGEVLSENATSDPRFADADSVRLQQIRSVLAVPIVTPERTMGAIYLDNRKTDRRFGDREQRFVGILAKLSALAVQNAERYAELSLDCERFRRQLSQLAPFSEIIGRSRPMQDLLKNIERVARTDFSVLLVGESGSGKELVARALHSASARTQAPFIVQNCAAIPTELLESEFFGHSRGAFTGAHVEREGLFRLADGGTLFLDEIADLDLRLQAKLLRVLEDGMIRPLGSRIATSVNVRLISATSVDLKASLQSGRFRQDLYYRLNSVTLRVPPLRERRADIPLLLRHFLTKHCPVPSDVPSITPAALRSLQLHSWPGNVRQLEHFAKRALVLSDRKIIDENDLDRFLDNDVSSDHPDLPVGTMTLREMEEWAIREALRRTGGNRAQAAEILGIHRNALLRRLEKLDGA